MKALISVYDKTGVVEFARGLAALGVLLLMANLEVFRWFDWGKWWPLALIIIGAAALHINPL